MTTENIKKHNLDFYFHIFLVLCLKCFARDNDAISNKCHKKSFTAFNVALTLNNSFVPVFIFRAAINVTQSVHAFRDTREL